MTETYHQRLGDSMQGELENDEITIKLYHYTDDEYKVYDLNSIRVEFENKLDILIIKNALYQNYQNTNQKIIKKIESNELDNVDGGSK